MFILLAGMLILSLFKSSSSVDDLGELEFEPIYNYLFILKSSSEDYLFKIIFFYLSLYIFIRSFTEISEVLCRLMGAVSSSDDLFMSRILIIY